MGCKGSRWSHRILNTASRGTARSAPPTPQIQPQILLEEGQQEEPREGSGVHCEVVFYPLLHVGGILRRDWIMNRVGLMHC